MIKNAIPITVYRDDDSTSIAATDVSVLVCSSPKTSRMEWRIQRSRPAMRVVKIMFNDIEIDQ